MSPASTRWAGALLLLIYAVHGAIHLARGEASNMLWACNVGVLLIGAGCVLDRRMPIAVGVSWLVFGAPIWILDLCGDGELLVTSFGTHFGGLLIGGLAMRRLGWPRHTWLVALAALLALAVFTHLTTAAADNINLAFAVWSGWEAYFPSYALYCLLLLSSAAATFRIVEWLARRLLIGASETAPY